MDGPHNYPTDPSNNYYFPSYPFGLPSMTYPPPPPPSYEDVPAPPPTSQTSPIIVAVFGKTGTGKSSFIKAVTGKDVKIGHGLESCTKDVISVPCKIGNRDVILVDTPGFDDTSMTDTKVLMRIGEWLKDTYEGGSLLSGIIYLHRISDTRMDGSSVKNLRMFRKLCGSNNLQNVILATTMWDTISEDQGAMRESNLVMDFWKDMIAEGSAVNRVYDSREHPIKLVQTLLNNNRMVLKLQEELSSGKTLNQTEAGADIQDEIEKLRLQYAEALETAKQEMEEAQSKRDKEYQEESKKEIDSVKDKMAAMKKQQKLLNDTRPPLPRQRKSWYRRSWDCLGCSNKTRVYDKWTCESCSMKQRNVRY